VRDTATGTETPWPVLERTALKPGAQIAGPAIVAEDETSTLIGPGWRATVDPFSYIEMVQESA
jgi:N-methylhydantoinase A